MPIQLSSPAEMGRILNEIDAQYSRSPVLESIHRIASIMSEQEDRLRKFGRPEEVVTEKPLFAEKRGFQERQVPVGDPIQGPANMVPRMVSTPNGATELIQTAVPPMQPQRTEYVRPAIIGTEQLKAIDDAGVMLDPSSAEGQAALRATTGLSARAFKAKPTAGAYDSSPLVIDEIWSGITGLPVGTVTTQGAAKQAATSKRAQTFADATSGRQDKQQSFQKNQSDTNNTLKMADDFRIETEPFRKKVDSYNNLIASSKDPSAAGDLAFIYAFTKLQDPTMVTEVEIQNAIKSGKFGDKMQAALDQVLTGKRLAPDIREDFRKTAKSIYSSSNAQFKKIAAQYTANAKSLGLNPKLIVKDYGSVEDNVDTQKPKTVIQNGHTYTLNEQTGQYE